MIRRLVSGISLVGIGLALLAPALASAAPLAAWQVDMLAAPSNFLPGSGADYHVLVTNVGSAPTTSTATIEASLPVGFSASKANATYVGTQEPAVTASCAVTAQLVTCQAVEPLSPGGEILLNIDGSVGAPAGTDLQASAAVSGGGALQKASATAVTRVSAEAPPFGIFGVSAPSTDREGLPATAAGSHPYALTLSMYFPSSQYGPEEQTIGAGQVRDILGELARGYLVDPAATPVLCTEAEFMSDAGCPPASQIGTGLIASSVAGPRSFGVAQEPLYNMVPPPGSPSSFAFNAAGFGIFVHLLGGVRTDGDYGLYGYSRDILALGQHPLLGVKLQFWGDPSSPAHDSWRGEPRGQSVSEGPTSSLTVPAACEATPPRFEIRADSWESSGLFDEQPYDAADLTGVPAPVTGCNAEPFEPTISAQPTTDAADSPTGMEVDLRQAVDMDKERLSAAPLKNATVTLPEGLVANPSQADGLGVCTEGQIGYLGEGHYSKQPQSCPDASKLGTLEVSSPLLAEYTEEGTKLATDPQTGEAIPRPLHGSVYLAKPFDNPFGTLLALYLAVEDEQSGIVAKLGGKILPDPATGQLTAVFEENPELPLSDIHLSFFKGARASLTTPLTCGTHTTTTTLTPWSTPEGADAHPVSSFQTTSEPGGGACPTSEGAAPNSPSFTAGTITPQAGAYSPFVLRISREDGSQRLTGIDTLLPEGLTGRLAGIAQCSDAQIAQAESRNKPEEGILEKNSPSCPSSSEVGTVTVGAGSGPTPYYTTGHAYLAGLYKGAPLSLAVIVPAIAGPFDLGTVVTRVALYVDPETTRIHAVSDPLPTILDGIPLDVRSIELTMGRPGFTLNPTSCEPKAIVGTATSSLGQAAALSQRFQVGGCSALPFKPRLSLRLKGKVGRTAHPRLIANLRARGGEANIARAQVKLPPAAFIDQAHIRTICTRVQWAANTCPAGSVYGSVWATTPLLAYKLTGQVYLRSSSHKLPDLVAKLMGPASQPIEIDLDGKTDSVKGALRNTFEAVPDAPVSTFHLELFGGKRGLVEMSGGFCKNRHATVDLTAQSGKVHDTRPVVAARCPRKKGAHHKKHKGHRRGHGGKGERGR